MSTTVTVERHVFYATLVVLMSDVEVNSPDSRIGGSRDGAYIKIVHAALDRSPSFLVDSSKYPALDDFRGEEDLKKKLLKVLPEGTRRENLYDRTGILQLFQKVIKHLKPQLYKQISKFTVKGPGEPPKQAWGKGAFVRQSVWTTVNPFGRSSKKSHLSRYKPEIQAALRLHGKEWATSFFKIIDGRPLLDKGAAIPLGIAYRILINKSSSSNQAVRSFPQTNSLVNKRLADDSRFIRQDGRELWVALGALRSSRKIKQLTYSKSAGQYTRSPVTDPAAWSGRPLPIKVWASDENEAREKFMAALTKLENRGEILKASRYLNMWTATGKAIVPRRLLSSAYKQRS